jgi:hypothetical protein
MATTIETKSETNGELMPSLRENCGGLVKAGQLEHEEARSGAPLPQKVKGGD